MATTTLRLSAARSRSRRLDRLRLVMLAAALPTLLLAVLVAAPLALAADPTAITVTAPTGTTSQDQGEALPVTWTTNQAVASGQFSLWVVSPPPTAGTWARSTPPTARPVTPTRSP